MSTSNRTTLTGIAFIIELMRPRWFFRMWPGKDGFLGQIDVSSGKVTRVRSVEDAERVFGLTRAEAMYLFSPASYPDGKDASGTAVARRM